jgi:hypothetical protein
MKDLVEHLESLRRCECVDMPARDMPESDGDCCEHCFSTLDGEGFCTDMYCDRWWRDRDLTPSPEEAQRIGPSQQGSRSGYREVWWVNILTGEIYSDWVAVA